MVDSLLSLDLHDSSMLVIPFSFLQLARKSFGVSFDLKEGYYRHTDIYFGVPRQKFSWGHEQDRLMNMPSNTIP